MYSLSISNDFGHFGRNQSEISLELLLIARRSAYRQGMRYLRRGGDLQGNVANEVEIEQILALSNGTTFSFTQVRVNLLYLLYHLEYLSIFSFKITKIETEAKQN